MSKALQKSGTARTWRSMSHDAKWVLTSTLITNIGIGIQNLVIAKLLYEATDSTVDFGLTLIMENILSLSLQFVAGPMVDRNNPKTMLILAELMRGGVVCIASILLATGHILFWVLIAVVAINTAKPFYGTATFALAPVLAESETLLFFNSLRTSFIQGGQVVGSALAGPMLFWAGIQSSFFVDGVVYLMAAAALLSVHPPYDALVSTKQQADRLSRVVSDWRETLQLLRKQRGLIVHLLLMSADFLVAFFLNIALVPIVAKDLGNYAYWLSVLDGSFAVGSLMISPFAPRIIGRWSSRACLTTALGLEVVLFYVLATFHEAPSLVVSMLLFGAVTTVSVTIFTTSLQKRTDRQIRGRIGSARKLVLALLSLITIPFITSQQNASLQHGLWASGAILFVFFAGVLVMSSRRFLGQDLLGSSGDNRPSRKNL